MRQLWDTSNRKKVALRGLGLFALAASLNLSAFADDTKANSPRKSNAWATKTLTVSPSTLNLDAVLPSLGAGKYLAIPESNTLSSALLGLGAEGATPLFNLEEGGQLCLRTTQDCAGNDSNKKQLGLVYSHDFTAKSDGLDLTLVPRAGLSFDDDSSSALVGALVRIGDDLQSSTDINPNTWYFFAGAEAQALTYTPNRLNKSLDAGRFGFHNQVIVGDAQAGVAYRLGDTDLSLTYLRREARAQNYKFEEDAAALSFTWRH
ncbi:MAG: hypothetical protein V3U82_05105 [Robiginitomaculum sp.]